MRRFFRELLAYSRLALVVLLGVGVLVIIWKNYRLTASVWIWQEMELPTLWLMAITGIVSITLFWVLTKVRRIIRDVQDVRAERRHEAQLAEQRALAARLTEQERRIDAALRKSLQESPSTGESTSREAGE